MPRSSDMDARIALEAAGVSLLVSATDDGLPEVIHWGAAIGAVSEAQFDHIARGARWMFAGNSLDDPLRLGVVPEARFGWTGTPGLIGSRDGAAWSPAWRVVEATVDGRAVDGFVAVGAGRATFRAEAAAATMLITIEMLPTGLVRACAEITNHGPEAFGVDELTVRLPVPLVASEALDFAGRWAAERMPQRRALGVGAHRREGRHGRTGADAAMILSVGEEGFGYRHGEIWAAHTAWSGNHIHVVERDFIGAQTLGGGELLLPGEGRLRESERYRSPWVYFNYAVGLDAQAARFHEHLRALPVAPGPDRPVALNVWEAVYFHQDADRLIDLAERAAAVGIERFVLDDGWFGGRRHERAGLGDWVVSPDVWPDGLHPLIDRVHGLGMEFGLWFEPEMVNLDSDVARAHPEWVMQVEDRVPVPSRHQFVLNLTVEEAFEHVLEQMSAIFTEYRIDAVKWDHNRDLIDAGTAPQGQAAVSAQTRAFYRLFDELRRRFPKIEFESCSSGGGRIDLEVLERAQRVWVSDNIDPDDRQRMLWWTGQLVPLELMGSHIASGLSRVTGRLHHLGYRAATAVFGHLGVEWDLAEATDEEAEELGWWIDWYKQHRRTLLTGRLVRVDVDVPGTYCKGIVTKQQAIFSLAMLEASATASIGPIRFPGLDDDATYRVTTIDPTSVPGHLQVPWMDGEIVMTGAQLAAAGLRAPTLRPSSAVLFVIDRI
ncbi:MAG: alpha-galactosidase [Propionibacterium sp.]|nr:alpha-galactosidase [Propionibacterium sp.]